LEIISKPEQKQLTVKYFYNTNPAFNFEKVKVGGNQMAIWDLPGKDNLRLFWPNFYRAIEFTGIIYLINYEDKDTLNDCSLILFKKSCQSNA